MAVSSPTKAMTRRKSNKDKSSKIGQDAAPPEYQAKHTFLEEMGSQLPKVFEPKFNRIRTVSEKELM